MLVVVALVWGAEVGGPEVKLRAAPLMGRWDWRLGPGLVPAVVVGGAAVWWGPRLAARLSWRRVLGLVWAASVAWTVALAAADGWDRVTEPLTSRHEYEPLAARIGDIGGFVATYVEDLPGRPIHVQGHPPGPVVVAWLADAAGLGGAGWLAALTTGAWGGAAVAALVALRTVAGEGAARRAAPALVVLPAAVWAGTSLDGMFAGLVALAVALGALAGARGSTGLAVASGAAFGGALLSSYGAVPLVLVVAAAVAAGAAATTRPGPRTGDPSIPTGDGRGVMDLTAVPGSFGDGEGHPGWDRPGRRSAFPWRTVATGAIVGGAALAALVGAAAAGFWWLDGLDATRQAYWSGAASDRPAVYLTLVGNPAALSLAVGPAVAAGLAQVWRSRGHASGSRTRGEAMGLSERNPLPHADRGTPATRGQGGAVRPWASRSRAWVLPVAALIAVGAADLSQYSRGEVERIWLPFVPWLALVAPGDRRGWLAVQVMVALTLQAALRSPW